MSGGTRFQWHVMQVSRVTMLAFVVLPLQTIVEDRHTNDEWSIIFLSGVTFMREGPFLNKRDVVNKYKRRRFCQSVEWAPCLMPPTRPTGHHSYYHVSANE